MTALYNEIDVDAADVLRQLIADGVIAPGVVNTTSIKELTADDLRGFTQCHFFAGGGLVRRSRR
jgi:DNA (cytosine-5)-methyltransferase 1